jgi:chemotaxis protein CheX
VSGPPITELTDDVIASVVGNIASAFLGLELTRMSLPHAPPAAATTSFTACVQITGAWEGAVSVRCALPLAARVAAGMFDTEPTGITADDIHDAIGELANMVGGNVKALLPGPSALSLPAVIEGSEYRTTVPGTDRANELGFACEAGALTVSVFERAGLGKVGGGESCAC